MTVYDNYDVIAFRYLQCMLVGSIYIILLRKVLDFGLETILFWVKFESTTEGSQNAGMGI